MARISVVVTVHDGERHLRTCIESVLGQSFGDFELLAIDDASTDGSLAILREFSDRRLRVIAAPRLGRMRALNHALEIATSEYVAILDADDVALSHRLAEQAAFLDAHPDVALVGSRYRPRIDDDGREFSVDRLPTSFDEIVEWMLKGRQPLFHSSVAYRLEIVRRAHGYDETLSYAVDLDLYGRLASRHEIGNVDSRLSLKRIHPRQYFGAPGAVLDSPIGLSDLATVKRRNRERLASRTTASVC